MMIKDVIDACQLEIVNLANGDIHAKGCYICDLLSLVMSRAEENNAWVTVQTNVNVIAVAVLAEVACVIVSEGMEIDKLTIQKAKEQEVNLLKTPLSSYEIALKLKDCV